MKNIRTNKIKFNIVSPLDLLKSGTCNSLFLPLDRGQLRVGQQSHSIFTSAVKLGKITLSNSAKQTKEKHPLDYDLPAVYPFLLIQKAEILKNNKEKSGIYMLTNKVTKKSYIGKSANLRSRFYEYFSPHLKELTSTSLICKALIKFGYSNFTLSILEYCPKDILAQREQHFISAIKPQYNIRKAVSKQTKVPTSFIDGKDIQTNDPKKKAPAIVYPHIVQKYLDLTMLNSNRKNNKG